MKRRITHALTSAALLVLPCIALAHHGSAEDLGGQLVHATFDPSHLGVCLLVAGVLLAGYRLAKSVGRRQ